MHVGSPCLRKQKERKNDRLGQVPGPQARIFSPLCPRRYSSSEEELYEARVKEGDSEHMLLFSFILPLTIWLGKTWDIQIDQSTFHPHSTTEVELVGQTPNLQTSHPPWDDFYLKLWNEWYAKTPFNWKAEIVTEK